MQAWPRAVLQPGIGSVGTGQRRCWNRLGGALLSAAPDDGTTRSKMQVVRRHMLQPSTRDARTGWAHAGTSVEQCYDGCREFAGNRWRRGAGTGVGGWCIQPSSLLEPAVADAGVAAADDMMRRFLLEPAVVDAASSHLGCWNRQLRMLERQELML